MLLYIGYEPDVNVQTVEMDVVEYQELDTRGLVPGGSYDSKNRIYVRYDPEEVAAACKDILDAWFSEAFQENFGMRDSRYAWRKFVVKRTFVYLNSVDELKTLINRSEDVRISKYEGDLRRLNGDSIEFEICFDCCMDWFDC